MFQNAVLNMLGSLRTAAVITQHDPQVQKAREARGYYKGAKKLEKQAAKLEQELPTEKQINESYAPYEEQSIRDAGLQGIRQSKEQADDLYKKAYDTFKSKRYREAAAKAYLNAAERAQGMNDQAEAVGYARALATGTSMEEIRSMIYRKYERIHEEEDPNNGSNQ